MHLFHEKCIIQWFENSVSVNFLFSCPICRLTIHWRDQMSKKWSIPEHLLELEKPGTIQRITNDSNNDDDTANNNNNNNRNIKRRRNYRTTVNRNLRNDTDSNMIIVATTSTTTTSTTTTANMMVNSSPVSSRTRLQLRLRRHRQLLARTTGQSPSVILNPYHLVLTPTLESQHLKTLSLPRQSSVQIQQNNPLKVTTSKTVKRHSKSFINTVVDEIPVVNPAFNDGTIMPTAISDYDDPLRLHHLPQQNPHPDLVEIRTNQKHSPSTTTTTTRPLNVANDNDNNQLLSQTIITNNRSIPSFHLTKNVHSTLSKLSDPIEFCHLSSTTTTTHHHQLKQNRI
ncbi:hypothetical protein DERF_010464 [Dermatophagoides farinae]|nr:hypothetical protein DERF_010464 [Dermatophagoides farinae]